MKLGTLTLRDFRLHRKTELDLSKPLTLIVGPNEQGKTSIQEAAGYFFSGRARCTNERGVGAEELISDGADSLEVSLTWERNGLQFAGSRGRSRAGNHVLVRAGDAEYRGEAAVSALGDPDLMLALLDFGHFLGRDPRDQAKILQAALAVRATVDECTEIAGELLKSDDGKRVCADPELVLPLLQASLQKRLFGGETLGPAQLADAYKGSFETRKAKKAELDGILRANPEPKQAAPTKEKLADLQAEAQRQAARNDELQAEKGRLEVRFQQYEKDALRKTQLSALIATLQPSGPQTQPSLPLAPLRPAEEVLAEIDRARAERNRLQGLRPAADTALESARAAARPTQDQIRAIEGGSTACDGRFQPGACPVAAEKLEGAKRELPGLKRQLRPLLAPIDAAETALKSLDNQIAAEEGRIRSLESEHRAASQNQEGKLAGARKELEQVEARLTEAASVPGDLGAIGKSIEDHLVVQRAASKAFAEADELTRQHAAYAMVRTQVNELSALVEKLEATTWVLDPKRLPADLIDRRSEGMLERLNGLLSQVFGRPVEIALESTADGVGIRVFDGRGWRRTKSMSSSALLRLGSALSVVLAQTSGVGIACMDSADMLVDEAKDAAMRALGGAGLQHLIVIATARRGSVQPSGPNHSTYWIENGQAELLIAESPQPVPA